MSDTNDHPDISPVQLADMYAAVEYLAMLEGQNQTLVTEMSLAMLQDLMTAGRLATMYYYVHKYCDATDTAADHMKIADDITEHAREIGT